MSGYLPALLLTLVVEAPLYAFALQRLLDVPSRRGYAESLLANATSHPLAWYVALPLLRGLGLFTGIAAVETFVVAWEAGLLRVRLGRDLPLLVGISFLVNAASFGLGAFVLR